MKTVGVAIKMRSICILVFFSALAVMLAGCSNQAQQLPAGQTAKNAPVAVDSSRFVIAGSGTNLPITEKLAASYNEKNNNNIEVPKSIGSDGAIKAVQTGALDLGLISRDLTASEKAAGLKEIPYARVGIVFATHPSTPDTDVSLEDILKIHQGLKKTWSDGGKIVVLIRGMHDSSNLILFPRIPGLEKTIAESLQEKRWQVMYHDVDMSTALRNKQGAFGHTDTTDVKIKPGIKVLTVNGVAATPENIQAGTYPYSKQLSFVYKGALSERARAFVTFTTSDEGRGIILANGGTPSR